MKKWFLRIALAALGAVLAAQVPVAFKVFPRGYELFSQGARLAYAVRSDGNRVYSLPAGKVRVNLSASESLPLSLALEVKAGMDAVEAKLEPRDSLLSQVAEAATGRSPRSLAFSPDGKKLFVALLQEAAIEVFDVPSLKKTGRLAPTTGNGGFTDVQVLADRGEVWGLETDGNVQVFDLKTLAWKENFAVTGGGNAFFLPAASGRLGFYNADSGTVVALDAATRKASSTLSLGNTPRGAGGDGGTLYLSLFDVGKVAVVDTATWKVKDRWAAGKAPRPVATLGGLMFVGDMGASSVLVFSLATGKLADTLAVGSNPHAMAVAPGKWVALATRGKNNPDNYLLAGPDFGQVSLLDAKGKVAATVWGRNQPTGLAFSADAQYLAFTDLLDDNVELYRLR